MKQKEIEKARKRMRMLVRIEYYGHSNHLHLDASLNGKVAPPSKMSDEELYIVYEMVYKVGGRLYAELARRGLTPEPQKGFIGRCFSKIKGWIK